MKLTRRSKFGLRTSPFFSGCNESGKAEGIFGVQYTSQWAKFIIPTYDQGRLGSCVGHATANWIEAMIRKRMGRDTFADRQQIDSEAIYHTARDMFWKGQSGEGLYLHQGFQAAIAMGILPKKSEIKSVKLDLASISRQLKKTPLVMGQMIHTGWNNPAVSGFIRDGARIGGHAILMIGITKQEARGNFVMFQNSWGRKWGYGGNGILNEAMFLRDQYTNCLYCDLPDNFHSFAGWRAFVRKK